jgi:hypothetical protein
MGFPVAYIIARKPRHPRHRSLARTGRVYRWRQRHFADAVENRSGVVDPGAAAAHTPIMPFFALGDKGTLQRACLGQFGDNLPIFVC